MIKKLDPNVEMPEYKTSGSSGVDLMANLDEKITLKSGESCVVPTGLSISIPKDCEVQIRPRSGLAAKSQITVLNTPGTIDSDYRGELKIILFNHSNEKFFSTSHTKPIINSLFVNCIPMTKKEFTTTYE